MKALDLFSTIYALWKNPDSTLKRIILAEHRNYSLLLAVLESIGISFFFLYFIKAADVYSLDLSTLVLEGIKLSLTVFLVGIYLFSVLNYMVSKFKRTGAGFRGMVSGSIFALHPLAADAIFLIPLEVAVFGSYSFSNNPSPQIINPIPFYLLSFLEILTLAAAVYFFLRFSKVLFGVRLFSFAFAATAVVVLISSFQIAKGILLR